MAEKGARRRRLRPDLIRRTGSRCFRIRSNTRREDWPFPFAKQRRRKRGKRNGIRRSFRPRPLATAARSSKHPAVLPPRDPRAKKFKQKCRSIAWPQGISRPTKFINNSRRQFFASANFFAKVLRVCTRARAVCTGWDRVFRETLFARCQALANKRVFARSLHSFDDSPFSTSTYMLFYVFIRDYG